MPVQLEQPTKEKKMPSPELLRAWAASVENLTCWGLDAVANELEELRRSLAREENARKVLADENTRLTKRNAELTQHVTDLIDECQDTRRQLAAWVNQL